MRRYHVYILSSRSRALYVGVTGELRLRLEQHRLGEVSSFTAKYRIRRLVYAEEHEWVQEAIMREKQIKRWRRAKKVELIERENPEWEDLGRWL